MIEHVSEGFGGYTEGGWGRVGIDFGAKEVGGRYVERMFLRHP